MVLSVALENFVYILLGPASTGSCPEIVPVMKSLTEKHVLQETKLAFFVCNCNQFSHFFLFCKSFIDVE